MCKKKMSRRFCYKSLDKGRVMSACYDSGKVLVDSQCGSKARLNEEKFRNIR